MRKVEKRRFSRFCDMQLSTVCRLPFAVNVMRDARQHGIELHNWAYYINFDRQRRITKMETNQFAIVLIVFVLVVFALVRINLTVFETSTRDCCTTFTLAVSHDNYHSCRTAFKIWIIFQAVMIRVFEVWCFEVWVFAFWALKFRGLSFRDTLIKSLRYYGFNKRKRNKIEPNNNFLSF